MPKAPVHSALTIGRGAAALVAALLATVVAATSAVAASSSLPHLRISPTAGPPGTVITLTGHLTPSQRRENAQINYATAFIVQGSHAGLSILLRGTLTITHDGTMRLVVSLPLHADWAPNPMTHSTDRLSQTPAPSVLELAWPCRACGVGTFDVTAPATSLPFTGGPDRTLLVLGLLLILAGCGATAASAPAVDQSSA